MSTRSTGPSPEPMPSEHLDEQRIAAYVRGALSEPERLAVERALDKNPRWLAVVALLARGAGSEPDEVTGAADGGATDDPDGEVWPTGGVPAAGVVVGRYVLGNLLGRGASGVVCAAWDPELRRDVALKLVDPALMDDPARAGQRLSREAKALAKVEDPHVVSVFDVGAWRGRLFIAMERLDGGTLDDWRAEGTHGWRAVVRRYVDAAKGLAAAHHHGLVHRDFKPTNVMLDEAGRVVVVDFGLARDAGTTISGRPVRDRVGEPVDLGTIALTKTGAAVGTPAYMAPEQRRGQPVTPSADQYALCVALHEALATTLPDGVVRRSLPRLTDRVPGAVWRVVRRGRAEAAARRYPDMTTLIAALESTLEPRRTRNRWIVVGLAGVGLAGAVTFATHRSDPCDPAAFDPFSRAGRTAVTGLAPGDAEVVGRWERAWRAERSDACRSAARREAEADEVATCLGQAAGEAEARVIAVAAGEDPELGRMDFVSCAQAPASEAVPSPEALALEESLLDLQARRMAGDYEGLVEASEAAVSLADALGDDRLRVRARLHLGTAHENAGELEQALAVYDTGAEIAMAAELPEDATRTLNAAAWVAIRWQRDAAVARRFLDHAAAWSKRAEDRPELECERLRVLGHVESIAGDLDAADRAFEAAHAIAESLPEGEPEGLELRIVTGADWGALRLQRGDLAGARRRFETAAALQASRVGPDHPVVAEMNNNVAVLLYESGELARAKALFEDNLAVFTNKLGPDNARVGSTLVNLAAVELDLGHAAVAVRRATEAVRITRARHGSESAVVASATMSLGEAQSEAGQLEEAIATLSETRALLSSERGESHAAVARADVVLARTLLRLGRTARAHATVEGAVRVLAAAADADDRERADAYTLLGEVRAAQGQSAAAHEAFDRALTLADTRAEPAARVAKAALLLDQSRPADALIHLERACAFLRAREGDPAHLRRAQTLRDRARKESGSP